MRCKMKAMAITAKHFYDTVSQFYDEMIGFRRSLLKRIELYRKFISTESKFAADLGCGTGLDSIALSKNGLLVTGFDISPEMIRAARKNADRYQSKAQFVCTPLELIERKYYGKFDLVVSMGNTIANLDNRAMKKTLKTAYKLLKSEGDIVIQVLNYHKIISENNRIINISSVPDGNVIRFYDFHSKYLNFNILKYSTEDLPKHQLVTTKIYPHGKYDLGIVLKYAGFKKIRFYGSTSFEKFNREKSNDLVIFASKL